MKVEAHCLWETTINKVAIWIAICLIPTLPVYAEGHGASTNLRRNLRLTMKCIGDLGCFSSDPPFSDPVHRPISALPQDGIETTFLLYNRPNTNTSILLEPNVDSLRHSTFDASLETKVIIHGFSARINKMGYIFALKDRLLSHENYNVIILNWSQHNGFPYPQAVANGRVVGAQLGEMLQFLHENAGVSLESVHLIGHSLGAHVAGWAGERLMNLGRISGLDPAGPYFQNAEDMIRLDPTDALFVDVIHTNGGTNLWNGLGISQPIGHIDFYPNGGSMQVGCPQLNTPVVRETDELEDLDGEQISPIFFNKCSHRRVVYLYTESIGKESCSFQGLACDSWQQYQKGECSIKYRRYRERMAIKLGFHATKFENATKSQKFFLETGAASPYCI